MVRKFTMSVAAMGMMIGMAGCESDSASIVAMCLQFAGDIVGLF